jgi:hypothetical protein
VPATITPARSPGRCSSAKRSSPSSSRQHIEVGEHGQALQEIAGALAQDTIAITDQERGDMLPLSARMQMDDLVPHALGFCPQARS